MSAQTKQTIEDLLSENASLRSKLTEYEALIDAIRQGGVDAILSSHGDQSQLMPFEHRNDPFRRLVEKMGEGALILSDDGVIFYANQYMAEMLQTPLNKLIGSNLDNWVTSEDIEPIHADISRLWQLQNSGTIRAERTLHTHSGKPIPAYIAISIGAIESEQATLNIIVTDLTDQKRNEAIAADRRLAHAILEQAADAIVVCDHDGTVILASNSAAHLSGRNLVGNSFAQGFPLSDSEGNKPAIEDLLSLSQFGHGAFDFSNAEKTLHLQVSASEIRSPGPEGELLGTVIILSDVTHIIRAEQEAVTAQQKLQEQLDIASRARKALLSVVEDAKESETRLRLIASRLPGMIYQYQLNPDGTHALPYASDAIRSIFNVDPNEVIHDATKVFEKIHADDRDEVIESIRASAKALSPWRHHFRIGSEDTTVRWLFADAIPQAQSDDSVLWHGFVSDVTERRLTEDKIEQAARVFDQSREGIIITDPENNIVMVNKAFSIITGYHEKDVLGKNPNLLASGRGDHAFYEKMWQAIGKHGFWEGEMWNQRKDGSIYPEWLSVTRTCDKDGNTAGYVGIFEDITQRKEYEKHIQRLAHFDPLTELPNRTLLRDRIDHVISSAQRNNKSFAILFCDLDGFKNVNDALGHNIGDKLLTEVARRLRAATRKQDTVSRQGGDEFIVLLPDTDPEGAAKVADKILSTINMPYNLDGYEMTTTTSIGIAIYPDNGDDFDTLAKNADIAMYRAKHLGRNNYYFFSPELQQITERYLKLEKDIHSAVANQELEIFYQPQVSLMDGHVFGVEALLRWNHPQFGMISPFEFIPIAENSGEILRIGEWVTRTAAQQLHNWINDGVKPIQLSVNLTVRDLRQPNLIEKLTNILEEIDLDPNLLELEITESMLMEDQENVINTLHQINDLGIHLSIDDFGTGYSSLSYLKRLPVDQLKIDKTFIQDMLNDSDDAIIARSIIALGHSLGLKVIAEGVEQNDQLDFLISQRCDYIQGYLYSKPLPAEEMTQLLLHPKPMALSTGPHAAGDTASVLLVENDPDVLLAQKRALSDDGYNILTVDSAEKALKLLSMNDVSVIITAQRLSGMNGIEFLNLARELAPDTIRIILSDNKKMKPITEALNRGDIYKFLTKPWDNGLLRANVREAFQRYNTSLENRQLVSELKSARKTLAQLKRDS